MNSPFKLIGSMEKDLEATTQLAVKNKDENLLRSIFPCVCVDFYTKKILWEYYN